MAQKYLPAPTIDQDATNPLHTFQGFRALAKFQLEDQNIPKKTSTCWDPKA